MTVNSCWNKAHDDEPIFVLRAKDVAAVDGMGRESDDQGEEQKADLGWW